MTGSFPGEDVVSPLSLAIERLGDKREYLLRHGIVRSADLVVETLVRRIATVAFIAVLLALRAIPLGTQVHNIELELGRGGVMVRSAGAAAKLMAKEGNYATLRMPSGEMRRVKSKCRATIGQLGNLDWINVNIGKAGRQRHMGNRPHTRAKAIQHDLEATMERTFNLLTIGQKPG